MAVGVDMHMYSSHLSYARPAKTISARVSFPGKRRSLPMDMKQGRCDALLERHGRSFASELGVDISRNTPSPLFRVFTFALLASTRISADIAMHAARALAAQGWTTAAGMAQATWRERTDALNRAGYARYDEKTSSQLADSCAHLLDQYHGDLRQLRQRAERDPGFERKRLKQC